MSDALPSKEQCMRYPSLQCPENRADQCETCPKKKDRVSEERLRNTRAWADSRAAMLSGADVIVKAIDELLERRAADEPPDDEASTQRKLQAYPKLSEFFSKYALGSKLPPSCFVCGHVVVEVGVSHMELPDVVCCKRCKDASERAGSPPPVERPILEDECSTHGLYRINAAGCPVCHYEKQRAFITEKEARECLGLTKISEQP